MRISQAYLSVGRSTAPPRRLDQGLRRMRHPNLAFAGEGGFYSKYSGLSPTDQGESGERSGLFGQGALGAADRYPAVRKNLCVLWWSDARRIRVAEVELG